MNQPFRLSELQEPCVAFTAADFERMLKLGAFANMRAELVGGALVKMMPALPGHGERNATLVLQLHATFGGKPLAIATDLAIRIDELSVRAADIAVYPKTLEANAVPSGANILLAVEIADTTVARDLGEKLADYGRAGVAQYWVVDSAARIVHVMGSPKVDGGYVDRQVVRFGDPISVPWSDAIVILD
ncbi:Uma2 family endonuclease [uncultured Sphingomonas sp.]|uniref:Uma2 family endonuclease n=1 Tax=uncultured Sphingomonas sp. TaxID=158754 RepID=UPI0025DF850B|nr:Uma2 family endonuclease [uncultured Sphingomonas sp.]